MPGIDYAVLRNQVSISDVLNLLGFRPITSQGMRVRGVCPFQCTDSPRDFAAHLALNRFRCFSCGRRGNQIELWQTFHAMRHYDAAVDLCRQLNIEPPHIHRW